MMRSRVAKRSHVLCTFVTVYSRDQAGKRKESNSTLEPTVKNQNNAMGRFAGATWQMSYIHTCMLLCRDVSCHVSIHLTCGYKYSWSEQESKSNDSPDRQGMGTRTHGPNGRGTNMDVLWVLLLTRSAGRQAHAYVWYILSGGSDPTT